jgi:hypothetical protein
MSDDPKDNRAGNEKLTGPRSVDDQRGDRDDDENDTASPFGIFPLVILLVLIVGGLFVIFKMRDMASIQDCVSSGRKNCAPISVPNER